MTTFTPYGPPAVTLEQRFAAQAAMSDREAQAMLRTYCAERGVRPALVQQIFLANRMFQGQMLKWWLVDRREVAR